jgi:Transposase IS116/IS110/IS902 family/Transposase
VSILHKSFSLLYLVNARDTKNLPGRKTDVQESQWLLKLHTYGLLRNSFRPTSEIRILRAYWRQRDQHVKTASQCIQRIQKALTQMNLQLANVISDLSGKTGLQILRAVVAGERDPEKLADFRDPRIKASREDIIASLCGNWRAELLFQAKQELARYDFCQLQIAECDRELEQRLRNLPEMPASEQKSATKVNQPPPKKRKRRKDHNIPQFDLHRELQRISGVDLTRIDGIDVMTGQTVISEVGLDMSRWPSEHHFASWLGLCPSNELSGGKILKKRTRKVVNLQRLLSAWPPPPSGRAKAISGRSSAAFAAGLVHRRPSPLWLAPWPFSFTVCSSLDKTTWIVVPSSTSNGNETSSFNIYRERRHNSASKSWLYQKLGREFLESAVRQLGEIQGCSENNR